MKPSSGKFAGALLAVFVTVISPLVGYTKFQETTSKGEKPLDERFIQMNKIYQRSQRASRYASRVKAKYANDPKTLKAAQAKYETAKDKFDGWLTVLGLAISHNQKSAIQGLQFKAIAEEADMAANDFETYAEGLTKYEEPNPITGQTAASAKLMSAKASMSATATAVSTASANAAGPQPIPIVAEIIVGIAFSVYSKIKESKAAERQLFVTDMRAAISWKDWGSIKSDGSVEALPAPKSSPSPKANSSPTPKP